MPIIKKSGFELHPDGIFEARLINVEEADSFNPDWPTQFKCTFETEAVNESGQNLTIPYYVSQKLNSLSKLGTLVKTLGLDLNAIPNGQDFDTDDMLGKYCTIVIDHQTKKDGTTHAKIVSVSPAKAGESTSAITDEIPF